MITFKRIEPHFQLSSHISHYWYLHGVAESSIITNNIFPDTYTDIIINCGDPLIRENGEINKESSFISGIMKKPSVVGMTGKIDFIGISFFPGAVYSFFNIPINELIDNTISLRLLWNSVYIELEDVIYNAKDLSSKVEAINRLLLRLIIESKPIDPIINHALSVIKNNYSETIDESLSSTGISLRQLQRKFQEQVGLTPKFYSRIIRLKRVLKLLEDGANDIIDIAYITGFSDQSHMTRELSSFTGFSPGEIYKKKLSDVVFIQDSIKIY